MPRAYRRCWTPDLATPAPAQLDATLAPSALVEPGRRDVANAPADLAASGAANVPQTWTPPEAGAGAPDVGDVMRIKFRQRALAG